jgi:hypothetical protein
LLFWVASVSTEEESVELTERIDGTGEVVV